MLNRRNFTTLGTASLASLLTQKLWAEQVRPTASPDSVRLGMSILEILTVMLLRDKATPSSVVRSFQIRRQVAYR